MPIPDFIVEPGENPANCAVREVLEESGVHAAARRLAWVHVFEPRRPRQRRPRPVPRSRVPNGLGRRRIALASDDNASVATLFDVE